MCSSFALEQVCIPLPCTQQPRADGGSGFLQALAYYENPVRSGLVFGKLVGLYVLLACDLGVTLLFIGAQAVFFTTAGVLMLANVKFLIDRHYNGITNPILFPQQLLEPVMATAAELAEPLLVSEETAVAAVRAVYAALPRARAEVLSVLYCTSFKKTSQVSCLVFFSFLSRRPYLTDCRHLYLAGPRVLLPGRAGGVVVLNRHAGVGRDPQLLHSPPGVPQISVRCGPGP